MTPTDEEKALLEMMSAFIKPTSKPENNVLIPQLSEAKKTPLVTPKEHVRDLVKLSSEYLSTAQKTPAELPATDLDVHKAISDLNKRIQSIKYSSGGGGGIGHVTITEATDFDVASLGDNKYMKYSGGKFTLVASSGGGGVDGAQGATGSQGTVGTQGTAGLNGYSSTLFNYNIKTTSQANAYPSDGYITYNNVTQTSATALYVPHLTADNIDIDIFLSVMSIGQNITIQDSNNSGNYQIWKISASPINTNANTSTSYWVFPVTLVSSSGTGTTGFPNNHNVILAITNSSVQGATGTQGIIGTQGANGSTNRVNSITTLVGPWNWDSTNYDVQSISALANNLNIAADNGSPVDGQRMMFRIKDNGVARSLAFVLGSAKAFNAVGVSLPTTTANLSGVAGKWLYIGCIYNAINSRWDVIAVTQEA